MKVLVFILFLISLNTCGKNSTQPAKENMVLDKNVIELVKSNDVEGVRMALENGADVNAKDSRGRSLLLLAAVGKKIKIAKLLVEFGADVNLQDQQLDSPFLYAGANGQTELVKLFLKNGAKFDVFNRYNGTALIPACERGHVETVKVLTNILGFPINHVNRLGWTALMEAVILGDGSFKYQQIVKLLKSRGAKDIADKDGVTTLQHARLLGFDEIVKILES
ncbi:ankyrin repeat domain-containing protein [Chryseobacterium formosus]|uniref:Ankyrin repeat domain-containing protein n=1 Tax=Chryseobacterium formosus TaxID=1537363 RepID=A0ABT3XV67_9FLAO|nr:ankyrin repeat domain-containing protein [Chryseobacterium formosus]MCX8525525.1 ankyrin repeat domain-containing protein [Chryseobacterium formosus]